MAKRPNPCVDCIKLELATPYLKAPGKNKCLWHWLAAQPIELQIRGAKLRRRDAPGPKRMRVPPNEWPPGERWCSGCQSFVPLFYVQGSRCHPCNSEASHAGHIRDAYGITREQYDLLLRLQHGRCALCGRVPRTRRLAVDHDHATGAVRGLLCADNERGCNHAVLGVLEAAAVDSPLDMARRISLYLELSPVEHIRSGQAWPNIGKRPVPPARVNGPPPY